MNTFHSSIIHFFPVPRFLTDTAVGISVGTRSLQAVSLKKGKQGDLPTSTIQFGYDVLDTTVPLSQRTDVRNYLKQLKAQSGLKKAHISIPED